MMTTRTRDVKGGTRSVANPHHRPDPHPRRLLADLALQLGLGSLSQWSRRDRAAGSHHPGVDRTAVASVYSRIGRVVTAAVLATAGAGLAVAWARRRRPAPVPVVRCPIHGIAYDAELEMCPECSKTQATRTPGMRTPGAQPFETTGGTR